MEKGKQVSLSRICQLVVMSSLHGVALVVRYSEFVLQRVASLPRVEPQRSLKAAVLLYSAYLIHILNLHPKALEKRGT